MTNKKVVTGTKVITRDWDVDFVSVALFEVNDEKIVSDENVANAITYLTLPYLMVSGFLGYEACSTRSNRAHNFWQP